MQLHDAKKNTHTQQFNKNTTAREKKKNNSNNNLSIILARSRVYRRI